MKLFITGGTGYLGRELIPKLANEHDHLYLLVRNISLKKARSLFGEYPNVSFVTGDLTSPDLVDGDVVELLGEIDSIVHMGAYYDLKGDHETCYMQNILGTLNVLFFAKLCTKLKSFHYLSTVAISGDSKGTFTEDHFYHDNTFSNSYAQTKYEAERLVRNVTGEFKINIYRPGIIIGHSKSGEFDKVDGPYYFWRQMGRFKSVAPMISSFPLLPLPLNAEAILPVISVDHVAQSISKGIVLSENLDDRINCFHLVDKDPPKVKDLIYRSLAAFDIKTKILAVDSHPLIEKSFDLLGIPSEIIHYMTVPVSYSTDKARAELGAEELEDFESYSENIFSKVLEKFGGRS